MVGKIVVENIVASTSIARKLDLEKVAEILEDAKYAPKRFPGLVYKLKELKTAMLIFRSGKVNCTGAKNLDTVKKSIEHAVTRLGKAGVKVIKKPRIVVQNIVAVYDLGIELNLNSIVGTLGMENVEYEPEQFPGLAYRVNEPKVVLLLFGSGKVVCTGARKIKDVETAIKKLEKELSMAGFLH